MLGYLHPEYTVKYIAVSLIFFNSGLSLKTEVRKKPYQVHMIHTIMHYTGRLWVQNKLVIN